MEKNTRKLYTPLFIFKNLLLVLFAISLVQCSENDAEFEQKEQINFEQEILDLKLASDLSQIELTDTEKKSIANRTLNTINQALRCSEFKPTLFSGVKTIFAPTDAAFKKIGLNEDNICDKLDAQTLNAILAYHVTDSHIEKYDRGCIKMIDGNTAYLNTVKRFKSSINDNEVRNIYNQRKYNYDLNVFMTDGVLTPPVGNILETMKADKELSYLVEIIESYPELSAALSDKSSFFTIFAPSDFSVRKFLIKRSSGTIDRLIQNVGESTLQEIISYHVVDDCLYTSGLADRQSLSSIQGGTLHYNRFQNGIIDETDQVSRFVRNGQDILASNGIIHKINGILTPMINESSSESSSSGLNTRQANGNVSSVTEGILSTFDGIDAIGVAAEISHSNNAANVGRDLNPTELILFGNPRLGTPIMQANQQAGIDLPQKYLIYEDDEGTTNIAYNDISYIKARHGLNDDIPTLSTMTNALNNFASGQSDRAASPITNLPERGEGLIDKISENSFEDSYESIILAIDNNPNLRIISDLDHQANAARVGLELRPTSLIIFGNPNLGTPLMQSAQTVAIDLPQKILVWEDVEGRVHITYNDPAYLQSRHGITNQETILNTIMGALDRLTDIGAGL